MTQSQKPSPSLTSDTQQLSHPLESPDGWSATLTALVAEAAASRQSVELTKSYLARLARETKARLNQLDERIFSLEMERPKDKDSAWK